MLCSFNSNFRMKVGVLMNIKDKCWHESLGLLLEHDSLTTKEFIMLLRPMGFSKETIMDALNNLMESPLVRYIYDEFMLDI